MAAAAVVVVVVRLALVAMTATMSKEGCCRTSCGNSSEKQVGAARYGKVLHLVLFAAPQRWISRFVSSSFT